MTDRVALGRMKRILVCVGTVSFRGFFLPVCVTIRRFWEALGLVYVY